MKPSLNALRGLHAIRNGVVDSLTDSDLTFSPGGSAPSLGDLFIEGLLLEQSYSDSLLDLQQTWPEPPLPPATSLEDLGTRLAEADRSMESVFDDFKSDDWEVSVVRPDGTERTRSEQVEIYSQAMLILLGKSVVYLRAMDRALPDALATYIS
jgi:hypothetical protein